MELQHLTGITVITNSIEQSPWEANSHPLTQKIPRLLWNPKIRYHIPNSPLLVPILIQMNSAYTLLRYSIRSSLQLSSNLRIGLPSNLCSSVFPTKILYAFLISPMRATCTAYLILLDLITLIIIGEMHMLWSSSLGSVLQPSGTSSEVQIFFSSPCSLLSVTKDQG